MIHSHADCFASIKILRGQIHETIYDSLEHRTILSSHNLPEGAYVFKTKELGAVHELSNESSSVSCVTLNAYQYPLSLRTEDRLKTFAFFDGEEVKQWSPENDK